MDTVTLTINEQSITVSQDTTIWEAADSVGIHIPTLCHSPKLRPVAVCRVCAVEVEKSRTMPAACIRQVEEGCSLSIRSMNQLVSAPADGTK